MKPDWKDAPEWATALTLDCHGWWCWHELAPAATNDGWWISEGQMLHVPFFWKEAIEQRPE